MHAKTTCIQFFSLLSVRGQVGFDDHRVKKNKETKIIENSGYKIYEYPDIVRF